MGATLILAQGMTQSFTWTDIFLVVALVFLEAALSADNAVALAALVKHLPTPQQQNRALRWGIIGAYSFRIAIVFAAVWLVEYPPAQFLGACYLLWLAWQHFRGEEEGPEQDITRHANFWQTLVMVELTDLVFSFDSIAASVGVSRKAWVIIHVVKHHRRAEALGNLAQLHQGGSALHCWHAQNLRPRQRLEPIFRGLLLLWAVYAASEALDQ